MVPVAALACVLFVLVPSARVLHTLMQEQDETTSTTPGPAETDDPVRRLLETQSAALLAGDENGWMAAVDADRPALAQRYRVLFHNLHALGVVVWQPIEIIGGASHGWSQVEIAFCLASSRCDDVGIDQFPAIHRSLEFGEAAGRLMIVGDEEAGKTEYLPWDRTTLTALPGKRVILAGTASAAAVLRRSVAAADGAATAASVYARPDTFVPRFVVYFAASAEWTQWFGGQQRRNVAAYARPSGSGLTQFEIVVRLPLRMDLGLILRHEMGHVVTLLKTQHKEPSWLSEGVAEYIGHNGSAKTERISDVRTYVRAGRWNGHIDVIEDSDRDSSAFYGLSHLAVHCLANTYGESRLFAYVRAVADGQPVEATQDFFGATWQAIDHRCAAVIRRQAR